MLDIELAEEKARNAAHYAARNTVQRLKELSLTLALSESCTAGLISALLADIPGASKVLWGSFVCYTQTAKVSMLDLDNDKLNANGLVSRETALSMADMTLKKSNADLAISVTGLAGPEGDGSCAEVGTVWIALALKDGETTVMEFHFEGSRNNVRLQAVVAALDFLQSVLNGLT
jgi:PncC family amidohydrolase